MDLLSCNNYYNLPEYSGKNIFYTKSLSSKVFSILNVVFTSPFYVLFIYLGFINSHNFELIAVTLFAVTGVGGFGYIAALNFRKIKVNEHGISLINAFGKVIKHFDWDNIEHIHALIGPINVKFGHRIYISTDPQILAAPNAYTASSPEYMIIYYRPQIIHCIIKYWGNGINDYNLPKIWRQYIDKL